MTEFLENSSLYAIRRVLPGKYLFSIVNNPTSFVYLAELDTIYRQTIQEDEDNDDIIVKTESSKINEYLTYNWLEIFD
jgi:hypothetical protein